jgi:hypothetical protein
MNKAAMLALVMAAAMSLGASGDGVVYGTEQGTAGSLIVEARPLQAEVLLDGVPVGTAHDLTARPLYVQPGAHVLQFSAPGFIPKALQVSVRSAWGTRVWIDLVPDRRG